MTNFFDFHKDKLIVYSDIFEWDDLNFNFVNSFYKEEVLSFIKEKVIAGNPSTMYWETPYFTLIPQSIFHSKHIENYLELNFGELSSEQDFHFDILHNHQAVIVYTVPKWIKELKETYFPIIPLKHHASQLLARSRGEINDYVSIVVYKEQFLIIILKKGKLQICSSVEYSNEIDILYFLILHHQKLELSSTTKLNCYVFETNTPINQIQDSFSSFNEFQNYKINWYSRDEFYKTILCV